MKLVEELLVLKQLSVRKYSSDSLVPRPSHHLVFDCLKYAKTERKGLVHFIMGMRLLFCHTCMVCEEFYQLYFRQLR